MTGIQALPINVKKASILLITLLPMSVLNHAGAQNLNTYQDKIAKELVKTVADVILLDTADIIQWYHWFSEGDCGWSKDRGDYRSRVLIRAYNNFVDAKYSMNSTAIAQASKRLHDTVYASSMFESCWASMVNDEQQILNGFWTAVEIYKATQ